MRHVLLLGRLGGGQSFRTVGANRKLASHASGPSSKSPNGKSASVRPKSRAPGESPLNRIRPSQEWRQTPDAHLLVHIVLVRHQRQKDPLLDAAIPQFFGQDVLELVRFHPNASGSNRPLRSRGRCPTSRRCSSGPISASKYPVDHHQRHNQTGLRTIQTPAL